MDDNADTREMYALYFRSLGYTVRLANDGGQGVVLSRILQPDIIVMDLSMPAMDGLTATRLLRRDARTRGVPIVILTGYPAHAIEGGVLEAGANAFLTKPCLPEELEQHVSRILHARRSA